MTPYYQLNTRIQLIKESAPVCREKFVCSSGTVYDILKDEISTWDREKMVVVFVDRKNNIQGINEVASGSLSGSAVYPREVFKAAILSQSSAIIIVHNHPSGDTAPSKEDIKITEQIVMAGLALGIQVLDHLIIGENKYYSFTDGGRMATILKSAKERLGL